MSVNAGRADSGMFDRGHRNYAAGVLGRFISRDPIGHADGLNLYAYPTNLVTAVDPAGLQPALPWPGQQKYPPNDPYAIQAGSDFWNRIISSAAKINELGYGEQATRIRKKLHSRDLDYLPDLFPAAGFNNPFTKDIGLNASDCESGDAARDEVWLTALLFHEVTHNRTQSRPTLLFDGIGAHWFKDPYSWMRLEAPVYQAEINFLRDWASRSSGATKVWAEAYADHFEGVIAKQKARCEKSDRLKRNYRRAFYR